MIRQNFRKISIKNFENTTGNILDSIHEQTAHNNYSTVKIQLNIYSYCTRIIQFKIKHASTK